ncbi:hypothetical protein ACWCL1_08105 [Ligilactobacillus sp. LYQ135]
MENEFEFAVTVHKPGDKVINALKGINLKEDEDGSITFAYNKKDIEKYEEAEDLVDDPSTLETRLTLGVINLSDDTVYPSELMTKRLAELADQTEDDITLDNLSSIDPDEFKDLFNQEVKRIKETYYFVTNNDEKDTNKSSSSESSSDKNPVDKEDENESASEITEVKKEQPSAVSINQSEKSMIPQDDRVEGMIDQIEEDPLLALAIERFKNECKVDLPKFDEFTHKQLQSEIINSEAEVNIAQNDAVYAIYKKLKDQQPIFERAFDEKYHENEVKHQETIDTLQQNETIEIKRVTEKMTNEYEVAKDDYVKGQKATLEAHYDKEHKADLDANLEHAKNQIHQKTMRQIDEENQRYESAREEAEDKFLDVQMHKVNIQDIIEHFDKENQRQISIIKEAASKFADQVAVVTKGAMDERDAWKEKCQQAEASKKAMQDTMKESIATGIEKGVDKRTQEFKAKENEMNKRDSENIQAMRDLTVKFSSKMESQEHKHSAELRRARQEAEKDKQKAVAQNDDEWRKKYDNLEQSKEKDYQKYQKDIQQIQSKNTDLEKRNAELEEQNADLRLLKGQTAVQSPVVQPAENISENKRSERKHSGSKWTIAGLSIVCAVLGMNVVYNAGQNSQAKKVDSQEATVSSAVSSSQAYKKGDQRIYQDPKNDKSYVVTMDSPSSGHYVDDKGVKHTLTYQN